MLNKFQIKLIKKKKGIIEVKIQEIPNSNYYNEQLQCLSKKQKIRKKRDKKRKEAKNGLRNNNNNIHIIVIVPLRRTIRTRSFFKNSL